MPTQEVTRDLGFYLGVSLLRGVPETRVPTQEVPRDLGFYLGVGLLRGVPQVGVLTQEDPRDLVWSGLVCSGLVIKGTASYSMVLLVLHFIQ